MDLDNFNLFKTLDTLDMLGEIDTLPDQFQSAWEMGQQQVLPDCRGMKGVIVSGMGGSAIGADLLSAYVQPKCKVPIFVHRDYGLPAWVHGPDMLVIASSHSGNTEETLDSFHAAKNSKCNLMVITTGGKLGELAKEANIPTWKFTHRGQPRAAVGFSFGLLLAAISRMGLLEAPNEINKEVVTATLAMKKQQKTISANVPLIKNPAKSLAGKLVGRWINFYGAGYLAPVARRWKDQINEIAKAGAGFETLPEADHNALAGLLNPVDILSRTMTLFLSSPSDHPRNQLRAHLTRQGFLSEGLNTESFEAQGESTLAHILTTLHFGDYMAYFLAILYGVDPTPIPALEAFKTSMKSASK